MSRIPTLGEAGLAWFRGVVRREGWWHGLAAVASEFVDLALDFLPSRKRLRYGDIDYDFEYRVNTTWAAPSLPVRLREVFTRGKYQPSEPALFHRILEELEIEYERFTFIDLGSGKGRTLLMASEYPFRKVMGMEIIPDLHAIAIENLARFKSERQRCLALEAQLGDAREFAFPSGSLVVYLFNPFPADVLREVLENARRSFEQDPREIRVVYHNLVHEDVFREMPWLHEKRKTPQYAVYHSESNR